MIGYQLFVAFILLLAVSVCQGQDEGIVITDQPNLEEIRPRDRKQYRPGDIIIGAAMQVTWENDNGECEEEITGMQLVETMNMIIDKVNANDSILPGVKLGTLMIDTCSSESHALQRVIMDILPLALNSTCVLNCSAEKDPHILAGVLGASLSAVSMQLARILQVFHIPQISYWSTSAELSVKKRFQYFFRSVAPDIYQADAIISLVKEMGWNYITVIYDDDNYGVDGYTEIVARAERNGICVAMTKALSRTNENLNMTSVIDDILAKKQSRVVILFTFGTNAEKLLMAAQENREAAESIVWIAVDAWTQVVPNSNTNRSFLDTLHGTVGFLPKITPIPNLVEYMTNLTLKENYGENLNRNPWFSQHISKRNNCQLPGGQIAPGKRICAWNESIDPETFRRYSIPISDALYAMVYALDAYHRDKCGGKRGLCEEIKKKAGTNEVAMELYDYLKNVSFTGSSGTIFEFDENHDGPPLYDVLVFIKDKVTNKRDHVRDGWTMAGTHQGKGIKWNIDLPEKLLKAESTCSTPCGPGEIEVPGVQICCWFCQKCSPVEYVLNGTFCEPCKLGFKPNKDFDDCEPIPKRHMEHTLPHSIIARVFGIFGIICTLYTTVIFIRYRETAIVRASGKELCFFVLFGVFLTLLNCFTVTAFPSMFSCAASRVILSIGPTIMYVGLLMKTIRVVFIFQSKGILTITTKQYLQPLQYTLMTTAVASIQIIVLVIWFILKYPKTELFYFDEFAFFSCKVLVDLEILIGLVYPFLIILVCTVLATINRNVPTGFKETLYIGFTMYTTCVIWLTFLPIFVTNSTDIPKKLVTVSMALSLSAITVLLCLFGPRSWAILFHPEWNTSENVMSSARNYETTNRRSSSICPQVGTTHSDRRARCYSVGEERT